MPGLFVLDRKSGLQGLYKVFTDLRTAANPEIKGGFIYRLPGDDGLKKQFSGCGWEYFLILWWNGIMYI